MNNASQPDASTTSAAIAPGFQPSGSSRVVTPASVDDVAATLRTASEQRESVLVRGEGSKLDWGRIGSPIDVVLDMRGLNRVLAHAHGDLTATLEAGARLRDVNAALAEHRQWLPLDPSFGERATIGGLLATNDSGPLRHRHGTPRDLVIGVQIATADGVVAKAGGRVVKNVAGYDLSKLVTGSFGSLAAIVSATFKLAPVPVASSTLALVFDTAASLARATQAIGASQLEPVAFDVHARVPHSDGFSALLQFASLASVVEAQVSQARRLLGGEAAAVTVLDASAEAAAWRTHRERVWDAAGAVIRVSWLPANLAAAIDELERIRAGVGSDGGQMGVRRVSDPHPDPRLTPPPAIEMIGRAAVGAGLIRIDGDRATQAHVIEQLRSSPCFGNVVLLRGSADLKMLVDVWGSSGDRAPLFSALKQAFDPHGILSPGRGPL